ncbi:polysaccharide biosynthesis protein [Parasphingorhabdus sp.]|uniref:polysaccharide biosynthesis protein n=1 Tax=Parasphingorhabdus sp. TaxID=2709688 RepID=UPI002B26D3A6|nr:polysaccharide biosynthesis protein [Parasphingorhabdus sp.]
MTISEAAQLVIQAAGMAKGGEVFVLDMGKSVKIQDLAETLVRLSGLTVRNKANPDGDIEIVEVWLRAGEKLYEELIIGNDPQATLHPRIMKAQESCLPSAELNDLIESLLNSRDPEIAVTILKSLVPEFNHGRDNDKLEKAS